MRRTRERFVLMGGPPPGVTALRENLSPPPGVSELGQATPRVHLDLTALRPRGVGRFDAAAALQLKVARAAEVAAMRRRSDEQSGAVIEQARLLRTGQAITAEMRSEGRSQAARDLDRAGVMAAELERGRSGLANMSQQLNGSQGDLHKAVQYNVHRVESDLQKALADLLKSTVVFRSGVVKGSMMAGPPGGLTKGPYTGK
jgi:hypothetical protein